MITDGEKWHYLAVNILSVLLVGITSNHKEQFSCLNCSCFHTTKTKLEKHYIVCQNYGYCYAEMP